MRQLPQGTKRQGALWADGLFPLLLNSKDRTLTRSPPAEVLLLRRVVVILLTMEIEFTLWYLNCFFLLLAEIARLRISLFYATVTGQASVTIYVISLASVISMA